MKRERRLFHGEPDWPMRQIYFGRDDGKATAGTEEKQYIELTVPAGGSTVEVDIKDLVVGTYDVAEVNEDGHSANVKNYKLTISPDQTVTIMMEKQLR